MIDLAITLARDNPGTSRAKVAAVLVNRSKVMAVGYNQYKSHPLQARYSSNEHAIFLHAEVDAIKNYIREHGHSGLSSCTMYVARVTRGGKPAMSKPCKGCTAALAAFDIEKVHWT